MDYQQITKHLIRYDDANKLYSLSKNMIEKFANETGTVHKIGNIASSKRKALGDYLVQFKARPG